MANVPPVATNSQITPAITEKLLAEAIKIKEARDDVAILNHQVLSESNSVNNYCSVGHFVTVTAKIGSSKSEYALFVKTAYEDEARKELTLVVQPIFLTESKMYADIIPAMAKLQKDKCGYIFGPSVPEYYHSIVNSDTGIVILHNYQPDGYRVISAEESIDYEHCKLVMKELAIFHALSWALKEEKFDYLTTHPFLSIYVFNERPVSQIVENNIKSAIDLVNTRIPDKQVKNAAIKLLSMDLNQVMRSLCKPKEPYAVFCHGDFHCHNILFKDEDITQSKCQTKPKIIDLQSVYYALPTTDLAVFFYSSTTRNTRKKHLTELLGIYHAEFHASLENLNHSFNDFTFEVLEDLFQQSILHGVLMSCLFLPHLMCDREESENLVQEKLENLQKEAADVSNRLPLFCEKCPAIQERLFDNFTELVEYGVI